MERRPQCRLSCLLPLPLSNLMSLNSSLSLLIASTRYGAAQLVPEIWFLAAYVLNLSFNWKEPELLRVDAERIQRQMQEVAVGNYRAFIAAADALLAIREEVSSIDRHLESLVIWIVVCLCRCIYDFDSMSMKNIWRTEISNTYIPLQVADPIYEWNHHRWSD